MNFKNKRNEILVHKRWIKGCGTQKSILTLLLLLEHVVTPQRTTMDVYGENNSRWEVIKIIKMKLITFLEKRFKLREDYRVTDKKEKYKVTNWHKNH